MLCLHQTRLLEASAFREQSGGMEKHGPKGTLGTFSS
jgi:hypothetical protein